MVNYCLYKIGQWLALSLPRKSGYAIAVFISDLRYFFAFADRKAVGENLKIIFPHKNARELNRIKRRMFRNFSKHMVDFFRLSMLDKQFIDKFIKIENLDYLKSILAKKSGLITLTAHLGSWELAAAVVGTLDYPIWVVALPHAEKEVDDFFNSQRQNKRVKVIPLGKAARKCLEVLRQNEILGLVGDRNFNGGGVQVEFFGKTTVFPPGPAAFALKTQSPILPGFMIRNKDDTFTFKFEHPIQYAATGNKERDLKELVNTYKKVFENYISKYPDQWFMFRRFWE